jgi:hypothetical protein
LRSHPEKNVEWGARTSETEGRFSVQTSACQRIAFRVKKKAAKVILHTLLLEPGTGSRRRIEHAAAQKEAVWIFPILASLFESLSHAVDTQ